MIPANELRINNWYNFKNPLNGTLAPTQFSIWTDALDFEAYGEPIELSAEVLEKAGFEKLPGSTFVYRIFVKDFEISVSTELHYAYIDTKWGQASIKHPIVKYLHQLQNLVHALTGEELTVTL